MAEKVIESMAMQSSFRCLLSQLQRCASPAVQRSIMPKLSTPFRRNLSLVFSTAHKPATVPPLAAAKGKCQHLSTAPCSHNTHTSPFDDVYLIEGSGKIESLNDYSGFIDI